VFERLLVLLPVLLRTWHRVVVRSNSLMDVGLSYDESGLYRSALMSTVTRREARWERGSQRGGQGCLRSASDADADLAASRAVLDRPPRFPPNAARDRADIPRPSSATPEWRLQDAAVPMHPRAGDGKKLASVAVPPGVRNGPMAVHTSRRGVPTREEAQFRPC
jgi:hypothetical protein